MTPVNPAELRCGRILYANDVPVYAAFDAGEVPFPGTFHADVPAALNQALLAGDLQCSAISSFFYAQHADELVLLPGVCIGARKSVRSVYCISPIPPERLARRVVTVSKETSTGRALFETICRAYYDFTPIWAEVDDPLYHYQRDSLAGVLIGDKAIDAAVQVPPEHAYDLGDLWHRFNNTEMVFAVWAARREFAAAQVEAVKAIANALLAAVGWGERNPDKVVEAAHAQVPRSLEFYREYYSGLKFRFDEPAQAGLAKFFEVAASCGVLPAAPRLTFFDEKLERV